MKNLSEGFDDLLGKFTGKAKAEDILEAPIVKKPKKSIFDFSDTQNVSDEIIINQVPVSATPQIIPTTPQVIPQQKQNVFAPEQIKIPQSIEKKYQDEVLAKIKEEEAINEIRKIAELRAKKKNKTKTIEEGGELTEEQIKEKMKAVRKEIEILKAEPLPENINIIKIEEEIDTALKNIPGAEDFDIVNLDIKASPTEKGKAGYFKTKVTFKNDDIPKQIAAIASYVKGRTKGLIVPRKVDVRVIANTNKTQLRGETLKLTSATVVFKPDSKKMKVNKGTRFILSVPENYDSTGNLIVYLQESRSKKIIELSPKDLTTGDSFNAFIGDRIAEYFFSGYDVVSKKLIIRSVHNPIMQLVTSIVATQEYKAKPYIDDENHVYQVDFYSKGSKNQWLYLSVVETSIPNLFDVIAKNTVYDGWKYIISQKAVTVQQMNKNLIQVFETCFNRDWSKELNIEADGERFFYLYDKLKHNKMKRLISFLMEPEEKEQDENQQFENNKPKTLAEIGLEVKEVLSKQDTQKAFKQDYDAESIIGKTDFVDYFIFTFLAYPIRGGDKRKGSDYITTQEYYAKYDVKDRRNYQEREATVLKKEGEMRNYNSRIYMFQLEYSVKDKKHIYRNTNIDVLFEETGILTNSVKFPPTKF